MKKIIVVQSVPSALNMVIKSIGRAFPNLKDQVIYKREFEKTLKIIPKDEELIVIASDDYHDKKNVLFTDSEKNGDRIAQEIKKINPNARVYIFSEYTPKSGNIDGYFPKNGTSSDARIIMKEIVEIFKKLGLNNP